MLYTPERVVHSQIPHFVRNDNGVLGMIEIDTIQHLLQNPLRRILSFTEGVRCKNVNVFDFNGLDIHNFIFDALEWGHCEVADRVFSEGRAASARGIPPCRSE